MWTLDRESPIPLYKQIEMMLRNEILLGNIPLDTILPSEQEYCDQLDVSRITIRKALDELSRDGLIFRQQGKGSMISLVQQFLDELAFLLMGLYCQLNSLSQKLE